MAEKKYFSYDFCIIMIPVKKISNLQEVSARWQYFQNKNCLCLILEIPNPTDYMNIVSYYAGDC